MIKVKLNPYYKTREITLKAEFLPTDDGFELTYTLSGELENVLFPNFKGDGARKDELWKKTCLECFIKDQESERYLEFNFSPSGDYSAYSFESERNGMANLEGTTISVSPNGESGSARSYRAKVAFEGNPPFELKNGLLGICAITEQKDKMEYWAIHHPSSEPDFHCPQGFILEI